MSANAVLPPEPRTELPESGPDASAPAEARPVVDIEHELTKGFAARLIRRKAKQLVGRGGFTRTDRADLEQEMKLRVWKRFPQFDPAKAHWNAFVTTVVERHCASILQRARRRKRVDSITSASLSELVENWDDELVELGDVIGPEDRERMIGRYVDGFEDQSELKLDVAEVMERLPEDLRRLCDLLKIHNVAEAARELGLPRTTVSSMVSRLRQAFVFAGFDDFPRNSSSPGAETR
ncbi:MAG: sigma-70 family RNA polymerase sigma factor [Planctomycetaceae bacterium]